LKQASHGHYGKRFKISQNAIKDESNYKLRRMISRKKGKKNVFAKTFLRAYDKKLRAPWFPHTGDEPKVV